MPERTAAVVLAASTNDDLAECVASLARSDSAVKLIVVNLAPADRLSDDAGMLFDARTLRATPELGAAHAGNLGIEEFLTRTACEFVLLLQACTSIRAETLTLLEGFMDEHPDAGMVTGPIVFADDPARLYYGRGRLDWRRGGGRALGFGGHSMTERALRGGRVTFAPSCAILLRREAIEKVGRLDERFLQYDDGTDLSIRMRKAGYCIFYCPEALIHYRTISVRRGERLLFPDPWSAQIPDYEHRAFHLVRNARINARKHARGRDRLSFLLGYPVFVLWKTLIAARTIGWRAFRPAWRGFRAGLERPGT